MLWRNGSTTRKATQLGRQTKALSTQQNCRLWFVLPSALREGCQGVFVTNFRSFCRRNGFFKLSWSWAPRRTKQSTRASLKRKQSLPVEFSRSNHGNRYQNEDQTSYIIFNMVELLNLVAAFNLADGTWRKTRLSTVCRSINTHAMASKRRHSHDSSLYGLKYLATPLSYSK